MSAAILLVALLTAHVGSADVFLESNAGPYPLFVTVKMPQVIPGVAEIEVRCASDDVGEIKTTVSTLTGPGSKYVPVPDVAVRSKIDPRFFTSSLWMMRSGALQVILTVDGARGEGRLSVPVASFAQRTLTMSPALGAILFLLISLLGLGMISIVGAARRESTLEPGAQASPPQLRKGRIGSLIAAIVVVSTFLFGLQWWATDAKSYARSVELYNSPKIDLAVDGGHRLVLSRESWSKGAMDWVALDHGHPMHLFLVRTPMNEIWHLHPETTDHGFAVELPSMGPGHYRVFADVVDTSGFPWTLVADLDVGKIEGRALEGDDSGGAIDTEHASLRVRLEDQPLHAGTPVMLRFHVEDASGHAITDLQPYMGMAAHAAIVKDDLSVFAHVHPSGSVAMASMMIAGDMPMAMAMPGEPISSTIALPYGFPQQGAYRIFLQLKQNGAVETIAFDVHVD